jgi:AAA ATPase-like protein
MAQSQPSGAAVERSPARPLVGRGQEIAALQASLSVVDDGCGQFVAVVGEAGTGKTRTIELEFLVPCSYTPDPRRPVRWTL